VSTAPARSAPARRVVADPTVVGAAVAFSVLAASQIALPLLDDRRGATVVVVASFAVVTACLVATAWGWQRAMIAAGLVGAIALGVEVLGSRTGWPFGDYDYTGALRPEVAGVPVVVPLAWFAMAGAALGVADRLASGRIARVVLGAAALTAWDLFLDPQMVDEGYWVWAGGGGYRGIPLTNYAGWFVTSLVVVSVLELLRPAERPLPATLVALYTWWAVMSALGFVLFFDDLVVAVAGAAGMGLPAVGAWRRVATSRALR
jgi:uncharacterized membrane protein